MNIDNETGLAVIMNHFEIHGTTLADLCNVSGAMISFWKKGTRLLTAAHPACETIATYVLKLYNENKAEHKHWLQKVFDARGIKIVVEGATEAEFKLSLMLLLTMEKINASVLQSIPLGKSFCRVCTILDISRLIHNEIISANAESALYICISGSCVEYDDNIYSEILFASQHCAEIDIVLSGNADRNARISFFTKYLPVLSLPSVKLYETGNIGCGLFSELVFILSGKSVLTVSDNGSGAYSVSVLGHSGFADSSSESFAGLIKGLQPLILSNSNISLRAFNQKMHSVYSRCRNGIFTKRSLLNPLFMSVETYTEWLYAKGVENKDWRIELFSERKEALEIFIAEGNTYLEYNVLDVYGSPEEYVETDDLFDEPDPPAYVVKDIVDGYTCLLQCYENFHVRFYPAKQSVICDFDSVFISSGVFSARKSDGTRLYTENDFVAHAMSSEFKDTWNNMRYRVDGQEKNAIGILGSFLFNYDHRKCDKDLVKKADATPPLFICGTKPAVFREGKYLIDGDWLKTAGYYNYISYYDSFMDDFEIILCEKDNGRPIPDDGAIPVESLKNHEEYRFALGCGNRIVLCREPQPADDVEVINCIADQLLNEPNDPAVIPSGKFRHNTDLTELTLPAESISIEQNAFASCYSLKRVHLSPATISIGSEAFRDCVLLDSIEIPRSVGFVGTGAFMGCTALKNAAVKTDFDIPELCFANCRSLAAVDISPYCKHIRDGAFSCCSSLERITLPRSLEYIDDYAFEKTPLTEVVLPTYLQSIGEGAFSDCEELKRIEIPASVRYIGDYAFENCDGLTIITPVNSTAWNYALENNISVREY